MSRNSIQWHIEERDIDALIPYDNNPRCITRQGFKNLSASINKFGLAEYPVITPDGIIIGGHARVKVLESQHEKKCDCVVSDRIMSKKEIAELNIRLNANIAGEWDNDMLANEYDIDDLHDWGCLVPWVDHEEVEEPGEPSEAVYELCVGTDHVGSVESVLMSLSSDYESVTYKRKR